MKVAVFGAISSMGQEVVEDLVFRGHEVIACVPDVARIPSTWGTGVKVVAGPVTDTATVEAVVTGAQAVVNVLGPGRGQEVRGSPLVSGTRLIGAAMAAVISRRTIRLISAICRTASLSLAATTAVGRRCGSVSMA